METALHLDDCLTIVRQLPSESIDLIYLDPPFCTQKIQKLKTRDRKTEHSFDDKWDSLDSYGEFLIARLQEFRRLLKPTGSLFFHCDKNAAHIARFILDKVFGEKMFRGEIIWHYRRWSNSRNALLPAHQNIYFYSKSARYKFNRIFEPYSASTNVDQILQMRQRDSDGKTVYARTDSGELVANGNKKGVPLSDVWDIPLLNPKASERTGYPTQKPILLLERIIELTTAQGDTVLDPFCGSGTTLVAAQLLSRKSIGIDVSPKAIEMSRERLARPVRTDSMLLRKGRDSYATADKTALALLSGLDTIPVHRNAGIDAILPQETGGPVTIRIQRPNETLLEAASALSKASKSKAPSAMILVATNTEEPLLVKMESALPQDVIVVESSALTIRKALDKLRRASTQRKPTTARSLQPA